MSTFGFEQFRNQSLKEYEILNPRRACLNFAILFLVGHNFSWSFFLIRVPLQEAMFFDYARTEFSLREVLAKNSRVTKSSQPKHNKDKFHKSLLSITIQHY